MPQVRARFWGANLASTFPHSRSSVNSSHAAPSSTASVGTTCCGILESSRSNGDGRPEIVSRNRRAPEEYSQPRLAPQTRVRTWGTRHSIRKKNVPDSKEPRDVSGAAALPRSLLNRKVACMRELVNSTQVGVSSLHAARFPAAAVGTTCCGRLGSSRSNRNGRPEIVSRNRSAPEEYSQPRLAPKTRARTWGTRPSA